MMPFIEFSNIVMALDNTSRATKFPSETIQCSGRTDAAIER
jgi:hypothetical protein